MASGFGLQAAGVEPSATGESIQRPDPGIARGRWEAPAWGFWVVAVAAMLGGLAWLALAIRTRRLRQGNSVGVWEVEVLPQGSDDVGVHSIVTTARRPNTPPFAFATMPAAPDPETLPTLEIPGQPLRYGAAAFERRALEGFPPIAGDSSR